MMNYPYRRVLIGFSLCPALAGVLMIPLVFFTGLSGQGGQGALFLLNVALAGALAVSLVAAVIYFPPAFLLALLYAMLKLKKGRKSYLFVAIMGGLGSLLWGSLIAPFNRGKSYIEAIVSNWPTEPYVSTFLLGATVSLCMAIWILPSGNKSAKVGDVI